MNSIEQAREALTKARDALAGYYRYRTTSELKGDGKEERKAMWRALVAAETALASPTTPVDGVGAEAVGYGVFRNGECIGFVGLGEEFRLSEDTDERRPLYAAPLASPEAEARLRERVAELERELATIRAILASTDVAALPDDYPTARMAEDRIRTLNERTLEGLALIGRAEAAEASLAQAEAGPAVTGAWQPIESAPRDGTTIDLWHEEFGRHTDHYWGVPSHECGEAGSFCDSDWHSISEGWVDGTFNSLSDEPQGFTHWMPHPKPPAALHPQSAAGEEGKQ